MFTGLVYKTGVLIGLETSTVPVITIRVSLPDSIKIGSSVAINGACLTVISIKDDIYKFNLSKETLSLSNYSDLSKGSYINIELPLKLNDFLDGHMVSGHIDGTVRVRNIKSNKDSTKISFTFQDKLWKKYIIYKGSVTLNGISLTVSEKNDSFFSVDIIPHTLSNTNLMYLKKGERVNIELDMIAKYIYNITKK
jgi:riboflavin synthase